MAKHRRDIKAAKSNELQSIEHSVVFDDNLLPDASEIERLSKIDPEIISWLKSRAEKEQDWRHESYHKRLDLVNDHNQRDHNTARFALAIYFILVSACIGASFYLVLHGHNLQGSMFGGAAVILALAVVITRRKPKEPKGEE